MLFWRAGWLLAFVVLVLLLGAELQGGLVASTAEQYQVGLALPAASMLVAPAAFLRYLVVARLAVVAIFWLVAALIFWRRPREKMALLVSFSLLLTPLSFASIGDGAGWGGLLSLGALALFVLLLFIFPDGRFYPDSVATLSWLALSLVALAILPWLWPPLARQYPPEEVAYGSFLFVLGGAVVWGVAGQLLRYRKAQDVVQRQQTRWVVLGLALQLIWIIFVLAIATGLTGSIGVTRSVEALLLLHLNLLIPLAVPLALGAAVLRFRLWDAEPLLGRTLVYGTLTALLLIVYAVIIGGTGALLGGRGAPWPALLAAAAVALLFQPLRRRLQRSVSRLLYGQRDDPAGVLSTLSEEMEAAGHPDEATAALVKSVATALKLPYVAIWLRPDEGDMRLLASTGRAAGHLAEVPLWVHGKEIGLLQVAPRGAGDQFSTDELNLLASIGRLAATTLEVMQLNRELQRARRTLVTARAEERRRLRRDLHDGLGPVLAALALQADTARDLLPADSGAAGRLLLEMTGHAQEAIATVRELSYGLRPPALDELGLVEAIRQRAQAMRRESLTVTVAEPEPLPPLPAAVEVAAYYIVLEAIYNTIQHARATTCQATLWLEPGQLCLEVVDDGRGLLTARPAGVGLQSIKERAAEVGGEWRIRSPEEGGLKVSAWLPVEAPDDE